MPPIVLDASIALAWAFKDEQNAEAERIVRLIRYQRGLVPLIWHLEIANVLVMAERRGCLNLSDTQMILADLKILPIDVDPVGSFTGVSAAVFAASRRYNLSIYDATYLELAQRHNLPLATGDRKLREAAYQAGVALA